MLHHRYEAERRPLTHIVQSIHNDLAASLSKFGVPEEEMAKAYHDMSYSVLRRELKESLLERLQAKHRALCAMRAAKRLVGPAFGNGVVGVRVMAGCCGCGDNSRPSHARVSQRIPKHVPLVADHVDAEQHAASLASRMLQSLEQHRTMAYDAMALVRVTSHQSVSCSGH